MSSSAELALIGRIVKTGEIGPALEFGISVEDFLSAETKGYWLLLQTYYTHLTTAGSVIDERLMQLQFKDYVIPYDWQNHTTKSLCYEVRKHRVTTAGIGVAMRLAENMKLDPSAALAVAQTELHQLLALGAGGNTDVTMSAGIDGILQKQALVEQGVDFSKMAWPWEPLQRETAGLQEDDYIVFYGRPKSMKTWVLCYLLAWAFQQEKKVLIYTKEMTPDNVFRRTAACICGLAYDEVKHSRLTHEHKEALRELKRLNDDPNYPGFITCLSGRDTPPGGDTVPWLRGKIDKYKPDIMFVDGLYLLSDDQGKKGQADHVRVQNISRGLRQMNLDTRVPLICTMQANRKAAGHSNANTDEIAYSDALGQDATIAARVIADKATPTVSIVIGGSREFRLDGFRINAVPAQDFSFNAVLTEKDIEKAKQADTPEDVVKKAAKGEVKRTPKTSNGMDSQVRAAFQDMNMVVGNA